ncbi:MAG: metallophosphoesterase [Eubacteriales bacterium]
MVLHILLSILFIIVLYFIVGILASRKLRIRNFDIPIDKVDNLKGFKIVLISDLHGRKADGLAETVLEQNADLIIFAGDMIDAYDGNADNAVEFAEKLSGDIPIIAVRGNHFYKACDDAKTQMEQAFEKQGIVSLKNQREIIHYNSAKIAIDGIDDPISIVGYNGMKKAEMLKRNDEAAKKAIENINIEKVDAHFRLAVCHRPSYIKHFQNAEYDLLLSGHTHGGQLALPFGIEIIGNEAIPIPPKNMTSGLHYHEKMPLIITSGIGYSNAKIRTFMPHEIVTITFV